MKLHVIGIDLGKTVFHLVGLDATGRAVKQMLVRNRKLCHKGHRLELNQAHLCRGCSENPP
jgi:hypothetical protein